MTISIFANAYDKTPQSIEVSEALARIKNGSEEVEKVRAIYQTSGKSEEYNQAKRDLSLVSWGGQFSGKKTSDLVEASGYLYFDDDTLTLPKEEIFAFPEVYAIWNSVSGNGFGGLVKYEGDYKKAYATLCALFSARGVELDRACSNINRLNFLSSDKDILIKSDGEIKVVKATSQKKNSVEMPKGTYSAKLEDVVEACIKQAERVTENGYVKGNKHNYLVQLVSVAVCYGVSYDDFIANIEQYVKLSKSGLNKVEGLYNDWKDSFGTKSMSDKSGIYIRNEIFNNSFVTTSTSEINQRWTSSYKELARHQTIKAAKNTGKTTLIKDWTDTQPGENTQFLISYRRTLTQKLFSELEEKGFENYLEVSGDFKKGHKYIVCVHSLYKIDEEVRKGAAIIVDEVESTLESITTDTNLADNRAEVRDAFEQMLSTATSSLLLDADLSDGSFDYLKTIQPEMKLLINQFLPKKGQNINIHKIHTEEDALNLVLQLSKDEIPYIPCSQKDTANVIHQKLGETGYNLNADTKVDYNEFLANPNNHFPPYLVTTPCYESGNSMENNHYTRIIAVFQGTHQSVEAFFQQINRERADVPIDIICLPVGDSSKVETKAQVLQTLLRKAYLAVEGKVKVVSDAFTELVAHLKAKHSRQVHQPLQAICEKATKEGYTVNVIEAPVEKALTTEFKDIKETLLDSENEAILEAENVDIEMLREKSEMTSTEKAQFTKGLIKSFTANDDIGITDIERFKDKKTWQVIHRLENFIDDKKAADADDYQKTRYFTDKDLFNQQNALIEKLQLDYFYFYSEDVTLEDLSDLAQAAKENADDIKALFGINVLKYKKDNNLVKALLALIGVETESKRITRGADKGKRVLSIKKDVYIQSVIARRQARADAEERVKLEEARQELVRQEELVKECEIELQLAREGKLNFSKHF